MRVHWIAALTALALAGCGGESLTHDEFVSEADKICADYNDKFAAARDSLTQDSTEEDRNAALEEFARAYEDMANDVTDLEPPENDRAIARYLDRLERNGRGFNEDADRGVLLTEQAGRRATNSLMEARNLAEAAGLRECSTLDY